MNRFSYERDVAFCDTDAMAVVHHANYLRYFEEARVAWMRARDLSSTHFPEVDVVLAVVETRVQHYLPAFFGDVLRIQLQTRRDGLRIYFRYAMHTKRSDDRIAACETVHVAVNGKFRPVRLERKFINVMESEPWIETWPWNS